jgi:hypothetical protein
MSGVLQPPLALYRGVYCSRCVHTPLNKASSGVLPPPKLALFRGVCTHLLQYTPLYSARGVVAPPKSPYSGGCVHTCCNTPPCVVRGGVVDTNSDKTQMPLECIRIGQNLYSNGPKRDSNAFEFAKTDIRMAENEIQMHLNSPKPIFRYPKTNIRISETQYSNIVFVIFGFSFSIFSLVMTYELYVGRPPCGISVHPRLDFGWSIVHVKHMRLVCLRMVEWIGLLPRLSSCD